MTTEVRREDTTLRPPAWNGLVNRNLQHEPEPEPEPGLEAAYYHAGLEPVVQHLPEVAYQQHLYNERHQNLYADVPLPKPDPLAPSSVVSPFSAVSRAFSSANSPLSKKGHRICGCSLLVFLLSVIIGILSAAVISLAAATGIETNRANDAAAQVAVISASLAAALPTSTAAPISAIDAGCSDNESAVTGTNYTAFKVLGALRYTLYCNRDTKPAPLLSLFTPDFATCMDACAAYTRYIPERFGAGANTTCGAVSFIPAWTDKAVAFDGRAPGNCYLKPAVNATALVVSTIGVDCHSAVYAPGALVVSEVLW